MDFRKVIYENAQKKKSFHNKHIYTCGSQTFRSFMKFYFGHIVKICFVFKNIHYIHITLYMHRTLPTLGNEKEQQQINFYEKSSGKLIFSRDTKNLWMIFHLPNWASAQKVRLYHWIYASIPTWTHSQNLLAAAEAPSLKISSHGTSLKWSRRPSQSPRE